MLVVENLYVNYGAIKALKDVSCHVEQGEIVAAPAKPPSSTQFPALSPLPPGR